MGGVRKLTVDVGLNGLTFTPNNITELPGTVVEFGFHPRNHTVTQSTFDKPCVPQENGFSSGFLATTKSPSGAVFQITIPDRKPIWFYCGQVNGNHCQAGMVGSINAPLSGNTLDAFIANAKAAPPPSVIPPKAPLGGHVFVNGNAIVNFNLNGGNAIDVDVLTGVVPSAPPAAGSPAATTTTQAPPPPKPTATSNVPKPGSGVPSWYNDKAGGGKPANYNWGTEISETTVNILYLQQFIEEILVDLLFAGYDKLNVGAWAGIYPKSIVDMMGSMASQALVHRESTADILENFNKKPLGDCTYKLPLGSVDDFVHAAKLLNLLDIGSMIDSTALVAPTDSWLTPMLATEVGAKSRMAAVVNLIEGHFAAATPREVMLPGALAWSYAYSHYVESCPDKFGGVPEKPYPGVQVTNKHENEGRTTSVTLKYDAPAGKHWVAWVGAWGTLDYSPIKEDGSTEVPPGLYGHVWIVVVSKGEGHIQDLPSITVAGPEPVWVNQPLHA